MINPDKTLTYREFKNALTAFPNRFGDTSGERFRARHVSYAMLLLGEVAPDDVFLAIGFAQGFLKIDRNHI